jgi:antitoxin component of MazEF toxin-antitoxin module
MKTRTLKIEAAGDYWRGNVVPKIRLTGQWLERAGFKPGNRVEIKLSGQGTITLRFIDQTSLPPMKPAFEPSTAQNSKNRTETGQLNFI